MDHGGADELSLQVAKSPDFGSDESGSRALLAREIREVTELAAIAFS
jgi:hypothetical protein